MRLGARRGRSADVRIREAVPADATGVAEVYLASRKRFLPYAPLAHPDAAVRRWIARDLIPSGGVTVAARDDAVVAVMALSRHGRFGWIDQLYVHPWLTGAGIGSRLLDRARHELGSPIRLVTFQANHRARRFYERHGFRTVAFGDGADNEERCPDVLYSWRA